MNTYIQAFPAQPFYARHPMADEHALAYQSLYMAASFCAFLYRLQAPATEPSGVESAREVVLKLTHDMGLSMSAAAAILRVTRVTLYSWRNLERDPQSAQMNRIAKVKHALAVLEGEIAKAQQPIEMHAVLPGGQSIYSLLSADDIDFNQLQNAARLLLQQPVARVVDITDEELEAEPVVSKALVDLFQDMAKWKNG